MSDAVALAAIGPFDNLGDLLADLTRAEHRLWDVLAARARAGIASLSLRELLQRLELRSRSYVCTLLRHLRDKRLIRRDWYRLGSREARLTLLRGEESWPVCDPSAIAAAIVPAASGEELATSSPPPARPVGPSLATVAVATPPTPETTPPGADPGDVVYDLVSALHAEAILLGAELVHTEQGWSFRVRDYARARWEDRREELERRAAALPPGAETCLERLRATLAAEPAGPQAPTASRAIVEAKPREVGDEELVETLQGLYGRKFDATTEGRIKRATVGLAERLPKLDVRGTHQLESLVLNVRRGWVQPRGVLSLVAEVGCLTTAKAAVEFGTRAAAINRAATLEHQRKDGPKKAKAPPVAPFQPFP